MRKPLPLFRDRREAGRQLSTRLRRHADSKPNLVVLGVSCGGMEVAAEVARGLGASLDVIVVHELTFPGIPGLVFGATCSDGILHLDRSLSDFVPMDVLAQKLKRELHSAITEREELRGGRLPLSLANRTVVLVDDGIGSGDRMQAAVQCVLRRRPERLIVAAPVCAAGACEELSKQIDELVSLHVPHDYKAAPAYYSAFPPVTRARVRQLLQS